MRSDDGSDSEEKVVDGQKFAEYKSAVYSREGLIAIKTSKSTQTNDAFIFVQYVVSAYFPIPFLLRNK